MNDFVGAFLFVIAVLLFIVGKELKKLPRHKDYEIKFLLVAVLDKLDQIIALLTPPVPGASEIEFYAVVDGKLQKVEKMFLKVNQNLPLSITVKDKFGNPAKVDGAPSWALTDPSLGSLETAEDGMSSLFKPVGLVGLLKIQVTADADLGEGVKPLLGELEVELLPGEAVSVELSAGTPVDQ